MKKSDTAKRLERLCGRFRGKLKLLTLRAGISLLIAAAIFLFALFATIDWRAHAQSPIRLLFLGLFLAACAVVLWLTVLAPLKKRWSNAEVLNYLDAAAPESQGMLVELYELSTARVLIEEAASEQGLQMVEAAETSLQPLAEQVHVGTAFHRRMANVCSMIALGFVLLLAVAVIAVPTHVAVGGRRLFNPFSTVRWPHKTMIEVEKPPTGWTVPQLEKFTVKARVSGEVPTRVVLAYRPKAGGYWTREKIVVQKQASADGDAVLHTVEYDFPEVREPLEFFIEGGDYETDIHSIQIIQRPYLKRIVAHYKYPSYAGIPDTTIKSGQLSGLEGTQVKLEFESSVKLNKALLYLAVADEKGRIADLKSIEDAAKLPAGVQKTELRADSPTHFSTEMMLRRNGRYRVHLFAESQHDEARFEIYDIRVQPDNPPEVELLSPMKDLVETNQAAVQVAFRASDQFGLKKVQFLYKLDDGEEQVLSDRITGPIQQTGGASRAEFIWSLRKMDLPESGMLTYFVRVQDNNPTGRGVVESQSRQVQMVRGSEFHLQAIRRAKLMEEEARICWRNQLHAYLRGGEWLAGGTGAEEDPLWVEMHETQNVAFVAAKQIQYHLQTLTEKYQRNQMAQDFMAGRLSVIAKLVNRLIDLEHTPIGESLRAARPRTAADAQPGRLKGLRGSALSKCRDNQKMAVLICERLLRKLYDWRDLQDCTIKAKLLYERQEEVLALTKAIAPKFIGNLMVDLSDEDQGTLLTLGKQQRAIFDTETQLEYQLTYLTYKAEKQQRKSILHPLRAAWANLRAERVNDFLKRAAMLIEDNQPDQVFGDQVAAIRALKIVQAGLVIAGQKIDKDEPLKLSMKITPEEELDPDLAQKPTTTRAADDDDDDDGTGGDDIPDPPDWRQWIPELTVGLSAAIRLAVELEDNVVARSVYLAANSTDAEMPRFVRLKLLRLAERQDEAMTDGVRLAQKLAVTEKEAAAGAVLKLVEIEFGQSAGLIAAKQVGKTTQQLQADAKKTLEDLLQFLALKKKIDEAVAENKRGKGIDAFGRKYLLRDSDLDLAAESLIETNLARQYERDVIRKLERFVNAPAFGEPAEGIEKTNRARAAAGQKLAAGMVETIATNAKKGFSKEVAEKIDATGVTALGDLKLAAYAAKFAKAADAKKLQALIDPLNEAETALYTTVAALRDALDARVQPKAKPVVPIARPTTRQFAEMFSREHIARRLKAASTVPPEIRDLMLRALERDFPPKYRKLLAAYFASFIKPEEGSNVVSGDEESSE